MSAIEQIYSQLSQVFGGNNPRQFFTLMMPGIALDLETYAYDIAGEKPVRVAEAESRLANQLFDVCQVTGTSNGRQLSNQYLQALDKLVPRFDPALAKVKATLRAYLAEPCTSVLADGTPFTGTRQELYFTLYDAWAERKKAWQELQNSKRDELVARDPGDPEGAVSAYDEWFATVAESNLMLVDAAEARLAAVMAPADMDGILGVLEAGTVGEIEEARRNVMDARLRSPSGGYVFPVELNPADWFQSLVSDAAPEDLLDGPEYLALKLAARRDALSATISQVLSLLSSATGNVADLAQKLSDAQAAYSSAQTGLLATYTANTATAADMYLAMKQKTPGTPAPDVAGMKTITDKVDVASGQKQGTSTFTAEDVTKLAAGQDALIKTQAGYLTAAQNLVAGAQALASAEATTYGGLQPYLARLQRQAQELDTLWNQIGTSAVNPPADPLLKTQAAGVRVPARSAGSDRFLDLTFYFETADMKDSSSLQTSASQTSWSVDLFFGSASGSSSSSSSQSLHDMVEDGTTIEIGMKATQVTIDREWFDPGIFALTGDLESLNKTPIAGPIPLTPPSKDGPVPPPSILPCFPVSFLVAKDITLKFQSKADQLHAARQVADSQSAVGGGFLCFGASHSESSHSESQSVSTDSTTSVITIHITAPQVIGWFMEYTPQDLSTTPTDDGLSILEYFKTISPPALAPVSPAPPAPAAKLSVPALVG